MANTRDFATAHLPRLLRAYMCDNAIRFYTDTNPDFVVGTVMEGMEVL
jgi:hypothetical protein